MLFNGNYLCIQVHFKYAKQSQANGDELYVCAAGNYKPGMDVDELALLGRSNTAHVKEIRRVNSRSILYLMDF